MPLSSDMSESLNVLHLVSFIKGIMISHASLTAGGCRLGENSWKAIADYLQIRYEAPSLEISPCSLFSCCTASSWAFCTSRCWVHADWLLYPREHFDSPFVHSLCDLGCMISLNDVKTFNGFRVVSRLSLSSSPSSSESSSLLLD